MDSVILTQAGILFNNRAVCINLLYSSVIVFEKDHTKILRSIDLSNLTGAKCKQNKNGVHYLELYSYEFSKSCNCLSPSQKSRKLTKLVFHFGLEKDQNKNWANAINNLLLTGSIVLINRKHATPLFKNYLVFVSPKSGKGQALKLFETIIKPMFEEASGQIQLVVTNRPNHAYDHVKAYDLSGLSAIVTIGGDGMLYEVINGLCSSAEGMQRLKTLPVIPLPAGMLLLLEYINMY